jgi:predicted murein hydrolase (TIGR00659 family)
MTDFAEIWAYLSEGPLVWLTATLVAFVLADALSAATGRHPLANPAPPAVGALALLLWATGTPYETYFEGAQFVHFLLGPATVALAWPLAREWARARRAALPLLAALAAGSVVGGVSALAIAAALGARPETLLALAPKSATAPVAMGVAEGIGGSPTLAAVLVIVTGVLGAMMATPLLNLIGVRDRRARGFAVGVAAHGIGTARAYEVNPETGAWAGLGMGLNAVATALIAPWIVRLFV